MDTRGQCGDSGCSAADTHMNTRGQWVTVAAVLVIHIWIHVASVVTVAAVLRYTYGYTWSVGDSGCSTGDKHGYTCLVRDSGCSAGDTHMDTRGKWVTVVVVLPIHICIHVASG